MTSLIAVVLACWTFSRKRNENDVNSPAVVRYYLSCREYINHPCIGNLAHTKLKPNKLKVLVTTLHLENIVGEVFYPPVGNQRRDFVIINSAYGVPKEFYYPFANYISRQGFTVLTYDYISLGDPKSFSLTDQRKIERCGEWDFETVLQWVDKFFPGHLIHVVGHGIGGSIVGFAPSCGKIKDIINIGVRLSTRFDWPKNHLLPAFLANLLANKIKSFFNKVTYLDATDLQSSSDLYLNRWRFRSRSKDITKRGLNRANYSKQFTGRILTVKLHDDVFHYPEPDPIQNSFSNSLKTVRNLYPTDLEVMHVGFFGLFNKMKDNSLWNMCTGWMADTIIIKNYPYATFDDSKFPIVQIFISDREVFGEAAEEYFGNIGRYLKQGPIYMLIDLTNVQWADSGMSKYASPWIIENKDLILKMHKYTVYVAPNSFIRYFLIFFHLVAFNNIIKPVQIFKDYHIALKWLQRQVDTEMKMGKTQVDETPAS